MAVNKVLYEELRPREFIERINESPIAYLPLGTLEWHGLQLPYGSDGLQAQGVFRKIAEQAGGIVLPFLFLGPDLVEEKDGKPYYGMDCLSFEEGHPQQLEGSVYYVEEDFFYTMLDVIARNLKRAGFQIVVGHGHGPSIKAFSNCKERFAEKYGLKLYTLTDLGYEGREGIQTDHAAANETSLVMALRPELADISELALNETPVGVSGMDPRKYASKEHGEYLIEKNVEKAVGMLKEIVAELPEYERKIQYDHVKNNAQISEE